MRQQEAHQDETMHKPTIYLINPPVFEDVTISRIGRCVTRAKADYLYPPTELLYIASYLRGNGFNVQVIDGALAKGTNKIYETLNDKIRQPMFFVTMVGIFSYKYDAHFIEWLKENYPGVPVIVFGQGASFITNDYLEISDYVIYGEPEKPILEIASGKSNVKGASCWSHGKKVISNEANYLEDLDDLPFPARDLIDNFVYRHAFMKPYAMVYSSRGCPYRCIFCTAKGYSPKYRVRSVNNVIGELKEIYHTYKIKSFGFMDETFTINKTRVIEVCKAIIGEKVTMEWIALGRVDRVDDETLLWMKKAGCKIIMYGIESGDQEVLDYLKKDVKVSQIQNAIILTRKHGIETHGFFIFGSPKDTRETILKTMRFAGTLGLDYASFNIYVPYPGTESYQMLSDHDLILTRDWERYDQSLNELVFKHDSLFKGEITTLIKRAYREFYMNPAFILRRVVRDLKDPKLLFRDCVNARKIIANYCLL